MHPAKDICGIKSNKLKNKKIILAVTGSIAAVESIKLARELIRHGAEVYPLMTKSATKIIHPDSIWFATSNKPIVELTGKTEHVYFCGLTKDPADLLLICPCTANTLSKISHGIDDSPVTTFATTAIGSKVPILIVPAMHLSMYRHKIVQKNIEVCKKQNIKFVEPTIERNKAKMPDINEILANVLKTVNKNDLEKKEILIIGGATAEPIDDVRLITNKSSGKTAIALANNAFERGANVKLWYGHSEKVVPSHISVKKFEKVDDLLKLIKQNKKPFDSVILCAAIADYIPKKHKGKIKSGKNSFSLEFKKAPKVIELIRKKMPKSKIIGFKVEESKDRIKEKSLNLLKKNNLDFVIGNTTSAFGSDKNEIIIIDKKGKTQNKKGKKEELAKFILDLVK